MLQFIILSTAKQDPKPTTERTLRKGKAEIYHLFFI